MTDLTYRDYLQVDALLNLQSPRTAGREEISVVLSEHFFIVAHQACELWLKQVLLDLENATALLHAGTQDGDMEVAIELIERSSHVLNVVHAQALALERLPVMHFATFRSYLGTASGAQSGQFRKIGALMRDATDNGQLGQAVVHALTRNGDTLADVCRSGARAGSKHRLVESVLYLGDAYWRWKIAHLALVSKMLSGTPGTGGTSGVDYLARQTNLPFAHLRQARGDVHEPLGA